MCLCVNAYWTVYKVKWEWERIVSCGLLKYKSSVSSKLSEKPMCVSLPCPFSVILKLNVCEEAILRIYKIFMEQSIILMMFQFLDHLSLKNKSRSKSINDMKFQLFFFLTERPIPSEFVLSSFSCRVICKTFCLGCSQKACTSLLTLPFLAVGLKKPGETRLAWERRGNFSLRVSRGRKSSRFPVK